MAVEAVGGQRAAVPGARPGTLLPGARAIDLVFAPLAWGEAPRVGVLGDSGTGKTEAERHLVAEYTRRVPGVAIVIDDKEIRPRFAGQYRRDTSEIAADKPIAEPRVLVLRGEARTGVQVDQESVARLAWAMAGRRRPVLVVYDELSRSAKKGEWKRGVEKLPTSFGQGRAVGISSIWGTQSPQEVPLEAFEQASIIICFRLDGRGLNLLRFRNYVQTDELEAKIRSLPGDDLPPDQRGEFVLLRRGRPWDGYSYRF